MKVKKLIAMVLVSILFISSSTTISKASFKEFKNQEKKPIAGKQFKSNYDRSHIEHNSSQEILLNDYSLKLRDNSLTLSIFGNDINLYLLPSKTDIYEGNTIIGVPLKSNQKYTLINFRIELSANSLALFPENMHLKNKTVLFLAWYDNSIGNVFYYQIELPDFDYYTAKQIAENNYISSKISDDDIIDLERNYITLKIPQNGKSKNNGKISIPQYKKNSVFNALEDNENGINKIDNNNSSNYVSSIIDGVDTLLDLPTEGVVMNPMARSLVPNVPDNLFKSGAFEKWITSYDSTMKRGFAIYPMRYAGTNNRFHYVMTYMVRSDYDLKPYNGYHSQDFTVCFKVTSNISVYYNITEKFLVTQANTNNRVKAAPTVWVRSNTTRGVITEAYNDTFRNGSRVWRVAQSLMFAIPHKNIGTGLEVIYYLSGGDLEPAKRFFYGDSYAIQASNQNGKIQRAHKLIEERIVKTDDYAYINIKGDGILSVNQGVTCSFSV